jgi:hypothetical protein
LEDGGCAIWATIKKLVAQMFDEGTNNWTEYLLDERFYHYYYYIYHSTHIYSAWIEDVITIFDWSSTKHRETVPGIAAVKIVI